ncbi:DNA polymerase [Corynebacterium sp. 13CS0277]|uniref:Y-family DNA polymerase n=1 Tax=Corynebacterium sp. 13CS0277 TaxID=2071994 RepID=UPI000D045E21|nr:DNA polymerase Y family protein [Corynebacterium sp. 13CS0277]PRQ11388.1 DNA polymerase [Corynebacterium sp. 13CS0277]
MTTRHTGEGGEKTMAVVCLWFPDWPAHAARLVIDDAEAVAAVGAPRGLVQVIDEFTPVAIIANHEVMVLSQAARQAGVRRGMRERHAKSVCPELVLCACDEHRDARIFEPVIAGLDEVVAGVEVVRPGLVVMAWDPVVKFYGGTTAAMEQLLTAASMAGVDTCIGVADEVPTAILAARRSVVVPPGRSREFLATVPLSALVAEESFGADVETVRTLLDSGVTTLGELADLPPRSVTTRFGAAGSRLVEIATARDERTVAPALPVPERVVRVIPAEPFSRVDEAAFCARSVGRKLAAALAQRGVVCQRLAIAVEFSDPSSGEVQWLRRTWHTRMAVDERMIAERVRWQLSGWLTGGGRGLVTAVEVDPIECVVAPDGVLWDAGRAKEEHLREVAVRLQAQLGAGAVLQPSVQGGHSPVDRLELVPFGDGLRAPEEDTRQWPGRLPGPHPAKRGGGPSHPGAPVRLLAADGAGIVVTREVVLSHRPARLVWGQQSFTVTGWSAVWPVADAWWDRSRLAARQPVADMQAAASGDAASTPAAPRSYVVEHAADAGSIGTPALPGALGAAAHSVAMGEAVGERCARMQLAAEDSRGQCHAWLLVWWRGGWHVEATYD